MIVELIDAQQQVTCHEWTVSLMNLGQQTEVFIHQIVATDVIVMSMCQEQAHRAQIIQADEIHESAALVLIENTAIDDHSLTRDRVIENVGTFLTVINLKLLYFDILQ